MAGRQPLAVVGHSAREGQADACTDEQTLTDRFE